MRKKAALIALVILAVIGALISALSVNMFMSDISNYEVRLENMTILITVPAVAGTLMFVFLYLYVLRLYQNPKSAKQITYTYFIIIAVFALIEVVSAILGGIMVYHSFLTPYPFPGYLIINIVFGVVALGLSITALFFASKLPEDEQKYRITFIRGLKNVGWFLFMLLAYNRLGMMLTVPVYIQWSSLYLTFPFYTYLAIPALCCVIKVLNVMDMLPKKANLILSIIASAANVVLFVAIVTIAMNNTLFISAVSPAMPLERLASMPAEIIIHFIAITIVSTVLLVRAIKKYKRS